MLAPALLRALRAGGHTRPNYRGRALPFPLGVLPLVSASLALVPLMLLASGHARPLFSLGLFAGPALIAGAYELRERAMLGDSGASLLGALAGLWLVLTLSGIGQLVAALLLALLAVYGELHSISEFIERTPGLRQLDSWGRPS